MRHNTASRVHGEKQPSWFWPVLLFLWCLFLCFVPDPRPLGAPQWAVDAIHSTLRVSEPSARAISTIILRGCGLALLGVFLSLSTIRLPLKTAAPAVIVATPVLAILCQWINYGHFPVLIQLQLGITSAIFGSLSGMALRRNWIAAGVLVTFLAALYLWGTATGISDNLADDARKTGKYLLDHADTVPRGDEGFAKLLELAFQFANDNSHGADALHSNKVAILALGVLLGEEQIAKVAKRPIILNRIKELGALRNRITLRGRNDLTRHFWVSAALVILSDENRSMTVGIGKEMMDSTESGSGFSFVDLMADRAGSLMAMVATKDNFNARKMQSRIANGVSIVDFFPNIDGLPEGIKGKDFQSEYGGLGGKESQQLAKEIESRIAKCPALQFIEQ